MKTLTNHTLALTVLLLGYFFLKKGFFTSSRRQEVRSLQLKCFFSYTKTLFHSLLKELLNSLQVLRRTMVAMMMLPAPVAVQVTYTGNCKTDHVNHTYSFDLSFFQICTIFNNTFPLREYL